MPETYLLRINGESRSVTLEGATPLLYVLRNDCGLKGVKFGCGLGQCGACTVILDGNAIRSCRFPVRAAVGHQIRTLEGLGTSAAPHPLQQAFIAEQAMQCGYCINGMIMAASALLERNRSPSEPEIRAALAGNLCRCGSHNRILRAIQRAAREMS